MLRSVDNLNFVSLQNRAPGRAVHQIGKSRMSKKKSDGASEVVRSRIASNRCSRPGVVVIGSVPVVRVSR